MVTGAVVVTVVVVVVTVVVVVGVVVVPDPEVPFMAIVKLDEPSVAPGAAWMVATTLATALTARGSVDKPSKVKLTVPTDVGKVDVPAERVWPTVPVFFT